MRSSTAMDDCDCYGTHRTYGNWQPKLTSVARCAVDAALSFEWLRAAATACLSRLAALLFWEYRTIILFEPWSCDALPLVSPEIQSKLPSSGQGVNPAKSNTAQNI